MVGSVILSLALVFSIISMVLYYLTFKGYNNTLNFARVFYHAMAIFVIASSTFLWYAILTHQYQYKYIFSYSNNSLSTGLLLSSFWGGQEGSFMLWLLLTAIIGVILQSYASKRGDLEPRVMTVFTLATTFLLVMVSPWFKNPFEYIWVTPVFIELKSINPQFLNMPFIQNFIFSDQQTGGSFVQMSKDLYAQLTLSGISVNDFIINGRGLNPQLLNFWMQIHPPILFIGFAMATVPFAFALAALMKDDYKEWINQAFPWTLAGTGILGLGIMLGGYWAYEMLGWGGYWAWDPVENSSLIPWLIGVAAIHTMLVQKRSQQKGEGIGRYAKTNLILSILVYVLVLYSTFLTRSGVLGDASVHSFVDPGMLVYLFLIVFISSFALLGFGMIAYRWKSLNQQAPQDEGLLSRELALFTAAVVLCASALIVFVGTSSPLFGQSVDVSFYNEMHVPLAIIVGLLNGISLILKWKNTSTKELINGSLRALAISLLITVLIVVFGGVTDIMMILLTFASAFALVVNAEIAINIIRKNLKMLGAYLAHIGLAIFILGVIGSAAHSTEKTIDLVKGKPVEAFGYQMVFTGYEPIENGTKYAFKIKLNKDGKEYSAAPVMYIAEYNNSLMREPSILVMPTKDIYIAPLGYDEGSGQTKNNSISIAKGETADYNGVKITFTKFNMSPDVMKAMQEGRDFQIGAVITIEGNGKKDEVELLRKQSGGEVEFTAYESKDLNLKLQLANLSATGIELIPSSLDSQTETKVEQKQEVLTVNASVKPFVSLVWIGVLVMVMGFFVAVARRLKDSLIG
ncbi:cytochrome c-type biogenesis CcmF C-terminal domain-containing protein [Ignavibacterium sp.]|uniref:heme lyase CcmF/NrfE family subunit n=1 Tax=Ignavibacterium sp. TaxID=2651167 RepID=UPI002201DF56|nr:cytochrome c-type biogenesis CcmF C-terminal domain-containing protein [Ignavibacterium sp.]BDQ03308.1 MAG: cytochrome c assembly protein [Ignavibacterium sp.]